MNEEEGFLQSIRQRPDDASYRLVYADWLEERGEPVRAEYLRLEQQLSQIPTRLQELRKQIDAKWLAQVQRTNVRVHLQVQRGLRPGMLYPVWDGLNFVGRADEQPVDIDLEDQEPPDRMWSSRQHAVIAWENGALTLEDLNSANGTYVNRRRVYPGHRHALVQRDVIQIGTVQLRVLL
jgi:uncharacterized protein (TIGR02996 family)